MTRERIWKNAIVGLGLLALAPLLALFSESARGAFLVALGFWQLAMALLSPIIMPKARESIWVFVLVGAVGVVFLVIGMYSVHIRL